VTPNSGEQDMAALEESLSRRFRVVDSVVRIGDRELSILHPASAEDLIDERDFERDERLPYWAELWPSARILGQFMLGLRGDGRSLLELGCGAGLVTTCASLAGFSVTASDYYDDAVRFARLNAWRNRAPIIGGVMLDWRQLPDNLERHAMVIASDVLYERPYGEFVARVIGRTLEAGGTAYVADPGRVGRESFLDALPRHGLSLRSKTDFPYSVGKIRQTIGVLEVFRTT
jgi:predicted nicotinamide N-methyase